MPLAKALAVQFGACLLAAIAIKAGLLPLTPIWRPVLAQAVMAVGLAAAFRSERWWLPIHLCFVPALALAQGLGIPPLWYLAAFVLTALVFWSSYRTRVPLYLSNRATAEAVAGLLASRSPARMLDLGSGTGGFLKILAAHLPDWRFTGVESSPLPYLASRWRGRGSGNVRFARGDFFALDWREFDVIYAFLSPVPMAQVWSKACAEMPPGSLLISNSFEIPGVRPYRRIPVDDRRGTELLLYRPSSGKGRTGR
ncbi:MAG: class I SAM-dependent methyltransferase [Rhodocyclaceae bacterium]|nr:class I SAM-dependent methyltransferase [Rhodocyclaceae bacterium]